MELIELHRALVSQLCELRARYLQMCKAMFEAEKLILKLIEEGEDNDTPLKS